MRGSLSDTLEKIAGHDSEKLLEITYLPQARFRVQAVTRCSSTIPGMSHPLLLKGGVCKWSDIRSYRSCHSSEVQSRWKVGLFDGIERSAPHFC